MALEHNKLAGELVVVHRWKHRLTWRARLDEQMWRASHAMADARRGGIPVIVTRGGSHIRTHRVQRGQRMIFQSLDVPGTRW